MKKIENNFAVTGFVAKDAEIHQFATASVARFPLAISRQEKNGEETNRISALMNMEAWRKNENAGSFDQLTKGTLLTVEGYIQARRMGRQRGREAQPHHDGRRQVLSARRKGRNSCGAGKGTEKRQEVTSALLKTKAVFGPLLFCSLP